MYSHTTGLGLCRALAGSHNRALSRVLSLRTIHSLSTTSTVFFCGSRQTLVPALALLSPMAADVDSSATERSISRREIVIVLASVRSIYSTLLVEAWRNSN